MGVRVAETTAQSVPGILLDRHGQSVVVGDGSALQEVTSSDTRIRRSGREITKSESVQVVVEIQLGIAPVAHVIGGNNRVWSQRMLNLEVPFHIFWILKVPAHVIQRRRGCASCG